QSAFFIFIAFFPFAILIFYIINLLPSMTDAITSEALGIMPELFESIFNEAMEQASRSASQTAVISISILAILWAASKGIYALISGLNSAYNITETRNWILLRIRATFYTFCFVILIVASLGTLVYGNAFYNWLTELFPQILRMAILVKSLRFVALLMIFIFFFMLIYKVFPNKKISFSSVIPGAVVAGFGWLAFSFLYSLYIDNYNTEMSVYGSLTAIVLLMLWLYSCMCILLCGALINAKLEKNTISLKKDSTKTASLPPKKLERK
ncbi:MAG: YihY/virulence factor BrkB family protein, partial [Clostridia bacterium]